MCSVIFFLGRRILRTTWCRLLMTDGHPCVIWLLNLIKEIESVEGNFMHLWDWVVKEENFMLYRVLKLLMIIWTPKISYRILVKEISWSMPAKGLFYHKIWANKLNDIVRNQDTWHYQFRISDRVSWSYAIEVGLVLKSLVFTTLIEDGMSKNTVWIRSQNFRYEQNI